MDFNETLSILVESCVSDAKKEGYEAGIKGEPKRCPYEKFTEVEMKNAWLKGYSQGKEKSVKEAVLSPQDILKAKKKEAALKVFKDKKKLRPGEDIMQDPADPSGKKWKVIPNQINKQAITNILTR